MTAEPDRQEVDRVGRVEQATLRPIPAARDQDQDSGHASPDNVCVSTASHPRRRTVLAAGIGIGTGLVASAARAQDDPARERPREGDLLVITGDTPPNPLTANDIPLGAGQVVGLADGPRRQCRAQRSRLNKVLLVRLDPTMLDGADAGTCGGRRRWPIRRSARTPAARWSTGPRTARFSNVPCHNSQYDPKAGARVIAGPSPRGLAALPLQSDGRQTDGCAAVHRSAGYPAGLGFGEPTTR